MSSVGSLCDLQLRSPFLFSLIVHRYQALLDNNPTNSTILQHSLGETILASESLQSQIRILPKLGKNWTKRHQYRSPLHSDQKLGKMEVKLSNRKRKTVKKVTSAALCCFQTSNSETAASLL